VCAVLISIPWWVNWAKIAVPWAWTASIVSRHAKVVARSIAPIVRECRLVAWTNWLPVTMRPTPPLARSS
jgi:hypothetical protein